MLREYYSEGSCFICLYFQVISTGGQILERVKGCCHWLLAVMVTVFCMQRPWVGLSNNLKV